MHKVWKKSEICEYIIGMNLYEIQLKVSRYANVKNRDK